MACNMDADVVMAKREADGLTVHYSAPPIPVVEIAESNGVDVVFATFGSRSDEIAGYCDFAKRKLFVNTRDPAHRQSFTIAQYRYENPIYHKLG